MSTTICFDFGNTRLKAAIFTNASLLELRVLENGSIQEIEKSIIGDIPASRLAFPEEIAYAATFLASDFAGYINGINLPVDGGFLKTL